MLFATYYCFILFLYYEVNFVIHRLARFALSLIEIYVWYNNPSDII